MVYGKQYRTDEIEHEVLITEAELLLGGPFSRNEPVGKTVADGSTVFSGIRFFVEVDNETMTAKQMHEKWIRYGSVPGFILLICKSKGRLKQLIRGAGPVRESILVARFAWLNLKNVKRVWMDATGKRIDLRELR